MKVVLFALLSGCVVAPYGYYRHGYYDRYGYPSHDDRYGDRDGYGNRYDGRDAPGYGRYGD